jgi:hypothetical protein
VRSKKISRISGVLTSAGSVEASAESLGAGNIGNINIKTSNESPTQNPEEIPPLVGEVVPTFADRGCCVVRATERRYHCKI